MTLEQRIEALERRVAELEEKQFDQAEYEAKLDVLAGRGPALLGDISGPVEYETFGNRDMAENKFENYVIWPDR
jgi:hypothetical protein